MRPVDQSVPRSLPSAPVSSTTERAAPRQQPQPSGSQRPAFPGSRDEFVPARAGARSGTASGTAEPSGRAALQQRSFLRQGGSGDQVKDLQGRLGIPQTGQFDAATTGAVRQYQTQKGLKVDGLVGQQTWGSLLGVNGLPPGRSMLGQGSPAQGGATRGGSGSQPSPAVGGTSDQTGATGGGDNLRATVDKVTNKGARNQMTTGKITINGHTYTYRSGGHGAGNLPNGDYKVTPHMWSRNTKGMVVDGVGFSFALSDKFDPRVGRTRSELRIHPDGGSAGTNGCMGIVGNGDVQRRFREDMRAELKRHGGSFTLHVG
ncbi:MAG TPA: peptidoglycan-binding domain-containing protein [Gemmatimonadales bacterium]|nr:peptidoglycan-binding domain-containing protein [Gemmatimonadales bacterium]